MPAATKLATEIVIEDSHTPEAISPASGENRRIDMRHAPSTRAAVWFDIGLAIGETCELKDISLSGFSISCDEWQLPVFLAADHPVYCVLLLGEAHFGCMVRMAKVNGHFGRLGFRFDAIPETSMRLVQGLIDYMSAREAEHAGN